MTQPPPTPPVVGDLIGALDAAVRLAGPPAVCEAVKRALRELCRAPDALDERWLRPVEGGYGRRLLHRDPAGGYTVVVMTWAGGQGTPVHDHAGLWCVECVYRGRIRVSSYSAAERAPDGRVRLVPETVVYAGVGEAGALIPPFDEHVIENPFDEPAATVHVYGGEMSRCTVFEPAGDGWYRRVVKELRYTA